MENMFSDNEEFDHYIKVTIIGNSNVGKTALLECYCEGFFSGNTKDTIGMETRLKHKNI